LELNNVLLDECLCSRSITRFQRLSDLPVLLNRVSYITELV
jgi:hypothetical protein